MRWSMLLQSKDLPGFIDTLGLIRQSILDAFGYDQSPNQRSRSSTGPFNKGELAFNQ